MQSSLVLARFRLAAWFVLVCGLASFSAAELVTCTKSTACEPWDLVQGPFCARGNKLNLRFTSDLAPENEYERYNQMNTEATYASCVTVDELSAVNLTFAGRYMGTVVPKTPTTDPTATETTTTTATPTTVDPLTTVPAGSIQFTTELDEGWISAYGFGGNDDIAFPDRNTSTGSIMVFSNDSTVCGLGLKPLVTFAILRISLDNGRFSYTAQNNQPTGVGFENTCADGECLLDASLGCIGAYGKENCVVCMTPEQMHSASIQVWLSYGGTDRFGKALLSYSNNPLNFRRYAGSSAYAQVANSVSGISSGDFGRRDSLSP